MCFNIFYQLNSLFIATLDFAYHVRTLQTAWILSRIPHAKGKVQIDSYSTSPLGYKHLKTNEIRSFIREK